MSGSQRGRWLARLGIGAALAALVLGGALVGAPALQAGGDQDHDVIIRDIRSDSVVVVTGDDEHGDHSRVRVLISGESNMPGGYLGVWLGEEIDHPEGGARILAVSSGSPADEAGIKKDDIIVGLNGDPMRGPKRLGKALHDLSPGDQVTLEVIRDDERMTFDVELAERPRALAFALGDDEHGRSTFSWSGDSLLDLKELREIVPDLEGLPEIEVLPHLERLPELKVLPRLAHRPKLGVQLVDTTPELRRHLGSTEDQGVLVSKVLSGMPAETAGIQVGDLITAVDGDPVSDSGDLIRALRDKDGETIAIELIRDGRPVSLDVTIPDREIEALPGGPRA